MEKQEDMENIPSMKLENNAVVEETITVALIINGKSEDIVLRKINSGAQGKIKQSCTKTRILAGQPQIELDTYEFKHQLVQASLVSAPFPTDLAFIKSLPEDVTSYLYDKWAEFASPTAEKKD